MNYRLLDETNLIIELEDGKKIHGLQRGLLDEKARVVILMHGLIGSPKSLLQYLGSRYLHEHGYTTIALYMYDYGNHYRDAKDCTLDTHVQDFKEVIEYLKNLNVQKLFAIGHSYGGLTILKSGISLDGAVLWDPSHGLAWEKGKDVKRDWSETSESMLISTDGPGSMRPIGAQRLNEEIGDTSELARTILYPAKIVTGDKSVIHRFQKSYFENLAGKKEISTIQNAGHSFDESDRITDKLFEETVNWLDSL